MITDIKLISAPGNTLSSIYATKASLSSYLTTTIAGSTYLTQLNASTFYATKASLSDYSTTMTVDATYLSKVDAASLYIPITSARKDYSFLEEEFYTPCIEKSNSALDFLAFE